MKLPIVVDDAEYELIKNLGTGEVPVEVCMECCPYFNISYECEEACPARTLAKKVVKALPNNSKE